MEFAGAGTPLTSADRDHAAASLKVSPEALWTIPMVETGGVGFLPDGRPKLLFERHLFRRLTKGRFDDHPEVSGPPGGYGAAGAHQYDRLSQAVALDRSAALMSTSWGLGQTLGLYHAAAGFAEVEDMVAAYVESEAAQLVGLTHFIGADERMVSALRRHDWPQLARRYNGPAYAATHYDRRLAEAYADTVKHGLPDWSARPAATLARVPAPAP